MPRVWGHRLQGSRQIAPQVWSIAPILSRAFGLLSYVNRNSLSYCLI